ncbi:MAG: Chitin synthase, class 5 [Thelocarpon impressellum]|nr:MAG: Chitin synthase, class 5 [Thelocarpon impressellum]
MLISLTVGKVDAGVAVLLTQDKRLIEFPSILLPPNISSGSIVDITVARNLSSEARSQAAFTSLQDDIFTTFGQRSPSPPVLRCRNATQTSVVLEWDPIDLATAELRTLSLYRNGSKAGSIPRPHDTRSTKISGLAVDTEYTFHLVLRTSAGTYSSEKLTVKTHKMTDLSGITVTPGVLPAQLRESLGRAVDRIGAKMTDAVRIDTTHFVCTEGRGEQWEKAVEMNIPVVRPEWLEGCEREGRIVGVRGYYLNADPRLRQVGQGVGAAPQQHQQRPAAQASDAANSRQASPRKLPKRSHSRQSSVDPRDHHDGAETPPSPPPKDEPEPKTLGDEPKARREDVDRLEQHANGGFGDGDEKKTDRSEDSPERDGQGLKPSGDGEGFTEVEI